MTAPPGIKQGGDTGYQGTAMKAPHKKQKGKALTPEQKSPTAPSPADTGLNSTQWLLCNDPIK
ncbi:MAG: hypothetical protein V1721_07510 [Pseudomonadota bacterium]